MKLWEAVNQKLSATAGVTALVGTRIYPVVVSQDPTFPLVVWTLQQQYNQPLSHVSKQTAELAVSCFAENFDEAMTLAYAVRDGLHGTATNWGTLAIGHCSVQSISSRAEEEDAGSWLVVSEVRFSLLYGSES